MTNELSIERNVVVVAFVVIRWKNLERLIIEDGLFQVDFL